MECQSISFNKSKEGSNTIISGLLRSVYLVLIHWSFICVPFSLVSGKSLYVDFNFYYLVPIPHWGTIKILSLFSANYMKDFVYLLYLHLLRICCLLFQFCFLVWKKIGLFLMWLTRGISFRWNFDSPHSLQTNPWFYIAGWEV